MPSDPPSIVRDALAHLRHDLRTPINQIIGYSELLQEEAQEANGNFATLTGDLEKINGAAKRLLALINENLVTARLMDLLNGTEKVILPQVAKETSGENGQRHSSAALAKEKKHEPTPALVGHLLVVDDDEENRLMLARRLARQGHTVELAESGRHALEMLRAPGAAFDLVLLDVLMPEMDGYGVLEAIKSDPALRALPVIMISALDEIRSVVRCIEHGAEDYLPKTFEPALLKARIGASLEKKKLRDQEQLYTHTIERTQLRLAQELADATRYVKSLLPEPLREPFTTDWRFIPSTELGGDAFGYHWIDEDHFALYLLDVCGHGVGAALLSATAINVLRSGALADTDFRQPGQVLTALNEVFQMERQNDMFFTLWYGVFDRRERVLHYASGGHPPALLLPGVAGKNPAAAGEVRALGCNGLMVGGMEGTIYRSASCPVPMGSRLFVVSDGTYEITKAKDGEVLTFNEFADFLAGPASTAGGSELDHVLDWARDLKGDGTLDDDFSILKVQF